MKYFFIITYFLSTTVFSQTKVNYKSKLTDLFISIKTGDQEKFISLLATESDYAICYNDIRPSKENTVVNKKLDSTIHSDYLEVLTKSKKQFEKVVASCKKNVIKWEEVVMDSVSFKIQLSEPTAIINGKIYCRTRNNSRFYYMPLDDLWFLKSSFISPVLYPLIEDIGSKNRYLTRSLKEEYINSLSKLMEKDRAWAEQQYIQDTEMPTGAGKVKVKIDYCKKELAKKK